MSACVFWGGALDRYGYGRIGNKLAHRLAYEQANGPIPSGLSIDHLCRNPRCVNPDHLEAVTPRENTLRGFGAPAVNARKTHCCHGHPFDEANTYVRPSGERDCRACIRARVRKYKQSRRGRMTRAFDNQSAEWGDFANADPAKARRA